MSRAGRRAAGRAAPARGSPPARLAGAGGKTAAGAADEQSADPVIILTYGYAGGARLQGLLSAQPDLAWTAGAAVLAAFDSAAAAWRQVEGRRPGAPMSQMAVNSVRRLGSAMMTVDLARIGRPRWSTTVVISGSQAETFLALFPGTKFICLHRSCPAVIRATLLAHPWGLAGPPYAAYTASYPASGAAALTAQWAGHAQPLLAFEQAHPQSCLRFRFEDLEDDPVQAEQDIVKFLHLAAPVPQPRLPDTPGDSDPGNWPRDGGPDFPLTQIPPQLRAQVDHLHSALGYPPLTGT